MPDRRRTRNKDTKMKVMLHLVTGSPIILEDDAKVPNGYITHEHFYCNAADVMSFEQLRLIKYAELDATEEAYLASRAEYTRLALDEATDIESLLEIQWYSND